LDAQIRKPDEVGERTSGLTPIQALSYLEGESRKFFKAQFEGLRFNRSMAFSTKMAADIAAQLASGLLTKLYEQIDPLRLAEYDRMMRIADHYGERIKTSNVKAHTIKQLLEGYPSHEFCIDFEEAKQLFNKVEKPSEKLAELGVLIKPFSSKYLYGEDSVTFFLDNDDKKKEASETKPSKKEILNAKPKRKKPAPVRAGALSRNGR